MEIMFDDLTPEAQERLLEEAGILVPEDMHWDEVPVALVEFGDNADEIDDNGHAGDIYDYDYEEQGLP